MRAGKLRHRVVIQRNTGTRAADGSQLFNWTTLATRYAEIQTLNAREFFSAQQAQSEISGKIIFRHPCDVRADDRITHDGKIYNVHAAMPTNANQREVVCMVSEGVNDGR